MANLVLVLSTGVAMIVLSPPLGAGLGGGAADWFKLRNARLHLRTEFPRSGEDYWRAPRRY